MNAKARLDTEPADLTLRVSCRWVSDGTFEEQSSNEHEVRIRGSDGPDTPLAGPGCARVLESLQLFAVTAIAGRASS